MIRFATASDLDDLVRMGRLMHAEGRFRAHAYDENYLRGFLPRLMEQEFVGIVPGCGFLCGAITEFWFDPTQTYAFDLAWYVQPDKRGGRSGYQLEKLFTQWAYSQGCLEVVITPSVEINNSACERLLGREGFEPLGRAMVKSWR